MTEVTVLVPTHRHAETLPYAVRSALAQRDVALEVFIVGDGVDDATRRAAEALVMEDPRVRFFDRPKGPRHGEVLRHEALSEARGAVIAYLSDDDLFYPDHLRTVIGLLADADFVQPLAIFLDEAGAVYAHAGTPLVPGFRAKMCREKRNVIPLTGVAHTRAFYESLPFGWRTSPDDVWTDLHMWRQILSVDGLRIALPDRPTVVVMPTPNRLGVSGEARGLEIAERFGRLEDEDDRRALGRALLRASFVDASNVEADLTGRLDRATHERDEGAGLLASTCDELASARRALAETTDELARSREERSQLDASLAELRAAHDETTATLAAARRTLRKIERSVTFRARRTLLRTPVARSVLLALAELTNKLRPATRESSNPR